MQTQSAAQIYFDPWEKPDYYYDWLPSLPLLYDKVCIYYSIDRWIMESAPISSDSKKRYVKDLLAWIGEGVIVLVVKGSYPANSDDVPPRRKENDGPTDAFLRVMLTHQNYARHH